MGVVWQVSESGSGPGFDASPYLMPLLGFRLFLSAHVIVRRVGGWLFILVDWCRFSVGLEPAVAGLILSGFRAVVLAAAGAALAVSSSVGSALAGSLLVEHQLAVAAVFAAAGPVLAGVGV